LRLIFKKNICTYNSRIARLEFPNLHSGSALEKLLQQRVAVVL